MNLNIGSISPGEPQPVQADRVKDWEEVNRSLDQEKKRAGDVCSQSQGEWAPGAGRTTGICAAFGSLCPDHVNAHKGEETLPPLVQSKPTDEMKFLEMQLVRAIYESLGEGEKYTDAVFSEKGAKIVNKSCQVFAKLIKENKGLSVVDKYPKQAENESIDFNQVAPFEQMEKMMDTLAEGQEEHCLLFFRNPNDPLPAGHVIYINFKEGVIGDGRDGLIWKIPSKHKDLFTQAVKNYVKENYQSRFKELSALIIKKDAEAPYSNLPLQVRKNRALFKSFVQFG